MSEPEILIAILAVRAVTDRIGACSFALPFRDYGTFRSYWNKNDGYGSWQARRDILNGLFDPLQKSTPSSPSFAGTSRAPVPSRTTATSATTA